MGAIQNSMNQLFASTMGAAFAVSQHPAAKSYVENKQLNRKYDAATKAFSDINNLTEETVKTDPDRAEKLNEIAKGLTKESYKTRLEAATKPEHYKEAFEKRLANEKMTDDLEAAIAEARKEPEESEEEKNAKALKAEDEELMAALKEMGINTDNINVGISRVSDGRRLTEATRTRKGLVLDPEAILMERYENAMAAKNAVKNRRELAMTAKQWMEGGLDG